MTFPIRKGETLTNVLSGGGGGADDYTSFSKINTQLLNAPTQLKHVPLRIYIPSSPPSGGNSEGGGGTSAQGSFKVVQSLVAPRLPNRKCFSLSLVMGANTDDGIEPSYSTLYSFPPPSVGMLREPLFLPVNIMPMPPPPCRSYYFQVRFLQSCHDLATVPTKTGRQVREKANYALFYIYFLFFFFGGGGVASLCQGIRSDHLKTNQKKPSAFPPLIYTSSCSKITLLTPDIHTKHGVHTCVYTPHTHTPVSNKCLRRNENLNCIIM